MNPTAPHEFHSFPTNTTASPAISGKANPLPTNFLSTADEELIYRENQLRYQFPTMSPQYGVQNYACPAQPQEYPPSTGNLEKGKADKTLDNLLIELELTNVPHHHWEYFLKEPQHQYRTHANEMEAFEIEYSDSDKTFQCTNCDMK